jgi:hypothetical protein
MQRKAVNRYKVPEFFCQVFCIDHQEPPDVISQSVTDVFKIHAQNIGRKDKAVSPTYFNT